MEQGKSKSNREIYRSMIHWLEGGCPTAETIVQCWLDLRNHEYYVNVQVAGDAPQTIAITASQREARDYLAIAQNVVNQLCKVIVWEERQGRTDRDGH